MCDYFKMTNKVAAALLVIVLVHVVQGLKCRIESDGKIQDGIQDVVRACMNMQYEGMSKEGNRNEWQQRKNNQGNQWNTNNGNNHDESTGEPKYTHFQQTYNNQNENWQFRKENGDRQFGSENGNRPYGDRNGNRQFEDQNGRRPFGNQNGNNQFRDQNGKRPLEDQNGNRPFGEQNRNRPYGDQNGKWPFENQNRNNQFGDQNGSRPFSNSNFFNQRNNNTSTNNRRKNVSPLEEIDPCIVHCIFHQMKMLDGNSQPDKPSVLSVMTQHIRDPELKGFIEESVTECFEETESGDSDGSSCSLSKSFAMCLEKKGEQNCEDWNGETSKTKQNKANGMTNMNNRRKG